MPAHLGECRRHVEARVDGHAVHLLGASRVDCAHEAAQRHCWRAQAHKVNARGVQRDSTQRDGDGARDGHAAGPAKVRVSGLELCRILLHTAERKLVAQPDGAA